MIPKAENCFFKLNQIYFKNRMQNVAVVPFPFYLFDDFNDWKEEIACQFKQSQNYCMSRVIVRFENKRKKNLRFFTYLNIHIFCKYKLLNI